MLQSSKNELLDVLGMCELLTRLHFFALGKPFVRQPHLEIPRNAGRKAPRLGQKESPTDITECRAAFLVSTPT